MATVCIPGQTQTDVSPDRQSMPTGSRNAVTAVVSNSRCYVFRWGETKNGGKISTKLYLNVVNKRAVSAVDSPYRWSFPPTFLSQFRLSTIPFTSSMVYTPFSSFPRRSLVLHIRPPCNRVLRRSQGTVSLELCSKIIILTLIYIQVLFSSRVWAFAGKQTPLTS